MGRRLAIVGVLALAVAACVATPNAAITGLATTRASQSPSAEAKSAAAKPDLATTVPWSPATAAPSPAPAPGPAAAPPAEEAPPPGAFDEPPVGENIPF